MELSWKNHISDAVETLHPSAMRGREFSWGVHAFAEDGEPSMIVWDTDRLGPLDMAALQAVAEGLMNTPAVPAAVSKAQAQMALLNAGLLDQLEAAIAAHPYRPVRIWYEGANVWERAHPYVSTLAPELGLTEEQIDALFIAAAKL